jgi:GrpB-like predicted nucleotidyltransferase (UPF0157 family)
MSKHIEISPYNPNWPIIYKNLAKSLEESLGSNLIELHHVGSTAVPGLGAKPIIDIIGSVHSFSDALPLLQSIGFEARGEMHLPFRQYFRKSKEVNLHLYEEYSPEIKLNLNFRDYLLTHPEAVFAYQKLKVKLLDDPDSSLKNQYNYTGYNLGKDEFIRSILKKAEFDEVRLMYCNHYHEWQEYHNLRKAELFDRHNIVYNPNHPTISDPNCYHFVLYKGVEIVSIAMIQFLEERTAALRALATKPLHRNKGFGKTTLQLLEKWLKIRDFKILKLHSALDAEHFYRKYCYKEMEFKDHAVLSDVIDLGKVL